MCVRVPGFLQIILKMPPVSTQSISKSVKELEPKQHVPAANSTGLQPLCGKNAYGFAA